MKATSRAANGRFRELKLTALELIASTINVSTVQVRQTALIAAAVTRKVEER